MTKPHHQVSETGLQLVMSFEGFRRNAARLADGRWIVGYGHTKSARQDASVTEADARALLLYDLAAVSTALDLLVFSPLNQNQFDALVCFAFNIGVDNFRRSSVLRRINEGALLQAASELELWRRAELDGERLVVDGLVRRRAAEKALFLTPPRGWSPVPTLVVQPRLDRDLDQMILTARPAELRADLTGTTANAEWVREAEPLIVLSHADELSDLSGAEDTATDPVFSADSETLEPFPAALRREPDEVFVLEAALEDPSSADAGWVLEPDRGEPRVQAPESQAAQSQPLVADAQAVRPPAKARFGDFEFTTVEPEHGGYGPLAALGVIGLLVFAVAIFWALSAHGAKGPFSPQVLGTLVALVGAACVVSAVYSLVQRYIGRDD
ncbi:MAG TPA: lysozyme [Caulobacteraceae bacterium]